VKELEQLKQTGYERQKQQFLDRFFIESADISGVGPARKIALKSFGIETAADVTKGSVMQVRGFGPNLTRAVLDWRAGYERRFQYNPALAVTDSDRNAVRVKHAARRKAIELKLVAGVQELISLANMAKARLNQLGPQAEFAAKALAQARADLAML
jgi:DNA-binding helix-hairpin-helix protein with protein kinase domain